VVASSCTSTTPIVSAQKVDKKECSKIVITATTATATLEPGRHDNNEP